MLARVVIGQGVHGLSMMGTTLAWLALFPLSSGCMSVCVYFSNKVVIAFQPHVK